MRFFIQLTLIITLTAAVPTITLANNLDISSASLTGANFTDGTIKAQFDISWANSWRSSANYDAAWVWVKYSTDGGGNWSHATLKTAGANPPGFSNGTGPTAVDVVVPADKMGAFIQRNDNGAGTTSVAGIQLVWDYSGDGVASAATVRIKVFGTEMVYIPQGAFYAGDNAASTASLKQGAADSDPWYINDSDDMAMNGGEFYYVSGGNTGENATGASFTIPAAFPNGFDAFYLIKYELSQGQYADFLNTITSDQASNRYDSGDVGTYRYNITGSYPNYSAVRPDRAMNFLFWVDVAAYADWAALRPMTELEFEKAARGNQSAVGEEYAWGTTSIFEATTITGSETGAETVNGNCNYIGNVFTGGDGGSGPLRCGIFATGSSDRSAAGASYYGVMELSGNLWEILVTVGNAAGRNFTGLHGDGSLDSSGNANTANWPGTNAVGAGFRGGSWVDVGTDVRTSGRGLAAYVFTGRDSSCGGRCGRTSP